MYGYLSSILGFLLLSSIIASIFVYMSDSDDKSDMKKDKDKMKKEIDDLESKLTASQQTNKQLQMEVNKCKKDKEISFNENYPNLKRACNNMLDEKTTSGTCLQSVNDLIKTAYPILVTALNCDAKGKTPDAIDNCVKKTIKEKLETIKDKLNGRCKGLKGLTCITQAATNICGVQSFDKIGWTCLEKILPKETPDQQVVSAMDGDVEEKTKKFYQNFKY